MICLQYVQYVYNICTIYVQYMYNLGTIYVQYMYNLCTIYVQYMYNVCTIYVCNRAHSRSDSQMFILIIVTSFVMLSKWEMITSVLSLSRHYLFNATQFHRTKKKRKTKFSRHTNYNLDKILFSQCCGFLLTLLMFESKDERR